MQHYKIEHLSKDVTLASIGYLGIDSGALILGDNYISDGRITDEDILEFESTFAINEKNGEIEGWISRKKSDATTFALNKDSDKGKYSKTSYSVEKQYLNFAKVCENKFISSI